MIMKLIIKVIMKITKIITKLIKIITKTATTTTISMVSKTDDIYIIIISNATSISQSEIDSVDSSSVLIIPIQQLVREVR